MNVNMHLKYYPVLFPAIGFTALLLLTRSIYSGQFMYFFLGWNIFLACVPLLLSQFLNKKGLRPFSQWLFFAGWLLFFPNALYIVTDLVHLDGRYPVPLWFDIILVFSAAANGLLAAYLSLWETEKFLRNKFRTVQVRGILLFCLFAGSFGVYLGRYLRWNSWDILTDPFSLLSGIFLMIIHPHEYRQTWGVTGLLTLFFTAIYFTIQNLRQMSQSSNT